MTLSQSQKRRFFAIPLTSLCCIPMFLGLPGCANNSNADNTDSQMGAYSSAPQSLSSAQLESLVSPIALYPDSLLSLMLLASTYPLEVAEAYNWRSNNLV